MKITFIEWELGLLLPQIGRNTLKTSHSCCLSKTWRQFFFVLHSARQDPEPVLYPSGHTSPDRSLLIPMPLHLSCPGLTTSLESVTFVFLSSACPLIHFVLFQIHLTHMASLITLVKYNNPQHLKSTGKRIRSSWASLGFMKPCLK